MLEQTPFSRSAEPLERAAGIATLVLAAAQPAAAYVTRLTGRGVTEEERARLVDGPVTPTPGTFGIWFPLFAQSLAHGAHLARSRRRLSPSLQRVAWLTSAAYACNSAWSLQAQLRGIGWPSAAIIAGGASSAVASLVYAERFATPARDAVRAANAIAPLAGWLTLATFANLEATANDTQGRPNEPKENLRAIGLLTAAAATGGAVAVASGGNRLYTGAIAWGLGGVLIRNVRERKRSVAVAAGLGFGAFLAATFMRRR